MSDAQLTTDALASIKVRGDILHSDLVSWTQIYTSFLCHGSREASLLANVLNQISPSASGTVSMYVHKVAPSSSPACSKGIRSVSSHGRLSVQSVSEVSSLSNL